MKKITCQVCGYGSFRYSVRKKASMCLKCGHEMTKEEFMKALGT